MRNKLNRKIAPNLHFLRQQEFPAFGTLLLDNGIPLYCIEGGEQAVFTLELVFSAGRWHEPAPQVAYYTARCLCDGTTAFSAAQLSDALDNVGAEIKTNASGDFSSIRLSGLSEFFPEAIQLLHHILSEANFPQHQLQLHLGEDLQELAINLTTGNYLAYRQLQSHMLGENHPYAASPTAESLQKIQPEILQAFFNTYYTPQNCKIYLAGKLPAGSFFHLNEILGKDFGKKSVLLPTPQVPIIPKYSPAFFEIPLKKNQQVALRFGVPVPLQNQPDFLKIYVFNTLLGGYFGARLMTKLRTEKGYTYGIYSQIKTYKHAAYCYISCETNKRVAKAAVYEIFNEIERLSREAVTDDELQMVKNYLIGNTLNWIDGPFNSLMCLKDLHAFGLDVEYFTNFAQNILQITPVDLQQTAATYFTKEKFTQVLAGV
ncbi:MAG: pitrilysin family protein [Chitinophagales bacterium]|nr:insulinase family protein [Chitinophagales bacterium]